MRSVVFLVLLAIAPAVWCQTAGAGKRSAVDVIGDCSHAAADDTYGLSDLEGKCPGLTDALEETGYLPLLSPAERDQLDVYGLEDLLAVDHWYRQAESSDVHVGSLAPILSSLPNEKPKPLPSWFERFKRWLRALLERRQKDPDSWLSRWLNEVDVSAAIARTILLIAVTLLIGVGIAVVLNELRTARILRRRPALPDRVNAGAAAVSVDADLDKLSVDRKAPMLLRMLVATLVRSGRLRTERSLTYRELWTRAKFDDAQQLDCFRRVAALAERTVYGSGEVSDAEVEPIVAAARALDAQLRGATA